MFVKYCRVPGCLGQVVNVSGGGTGPPWVIEGAKYIPTRAEMVEDQFQMVNKARDKAVNGPLHSDQGSQLRSEKILRALGNYRAEQRISRHGKCWDSQRMGSFFRQLKVCHNLQQFHLAL